MQAAGFAHHCVLPTPLYTLYARFRKHAHNLFGEYSGTMSSVTPQTHPERHLENCFGEGGGSNQPSKLQSGEGLDEGTLCQVAFGHLFKRVAE